MLRLLVIASLIVTSACRLRSEAPSVSSEILAARERWRSGDAAGARASAAPIVARLRDELRASPADPGLHMALAEALALEGHREEALAEARTAVASSATVPRPDDDSGRLLESMAIVAMEAGANDTALDVLEILLARGPQRGRPHVADDPRFAPLHADPRFSEIVALYQLSAASRL